MVELKVENMTISHDLNMSGDIDGEISLSDGKEIYKETVGGTYDYTQLDNLPSLDGEMLIGDVNEKDPTVPLWAKTADKPVYTQEDVGISSIPLNDIEDLFDM